VSIRFVEYTFSDSICCVSIRCVSIRLVSRRFVNASHNICEVLTRLEVLWHYSNITVYTEP
jgi:hypothetical protein